MKGWHNQNWRHSLAAKGVKTGRLNGKVFTRTKSGIPITIRESPRAGECYPISPLQAKAVVDGLPRESTDGIKEINFRRPGIPATKQDKAWAQYVRSEARVNIFPQKQEGNRFVQVEPENEDPNNAREHMEKYVIPHEIGHHVVVKHNPDMPLAVEEAIADTFAAKETINRQNVEKHLNKRIDTFGPKGTI